MLTLARLDPQSVAPSFHTVDLREVAAQVVAELTAFALAKGVELGLAADTPMEIQGDATMLAVLMRNLADNAVRYTPRGGTVDVQLARTPEGTLLTVTDNGPGIAATERERVGQRFYRVLGNTEPGSGLGLSIVQRICELHGAAMRIESSEQASGLRVAITFAPVP
jgi:signal transduction histidine kinase